MDINIEKMDTESLEETKRAAKKVLSYCSLESSKINIMSFIAAIDAKLKELTYQECVDYLSSQRNVPDELWNAKEAREVATKYVNGLTKYPKTQEELSDNYLDYLLSAIGV